MLGIIFNPPIPTEQSSEPEAEGLFEPTFEETFE